MEGHIRQVDILDIFQSNFFTYGMSVIEDRALADIRDGLKPVHRAIVYETLKSNATSTSKPSKVAKLSGAIIGNWHPHGDKAVEDALTGMAQPWTNTLPVIEIKGNGGSIFGDSAAAGRYIEARLTPAGDAYGYKLKEGIVPYVPNFDNTGRMPTILPAQLPYLLINGVQEGIAVGVAAFLPPHNAKEVLRMVLAYLKDPKLTTAQLLEYMPGPDFPSGATIINKDELLDIYKTGAGKIRVRATLEYEEKAHALHVREIPYIFAGSMDNLVSELVAATTETLDAKKKRVPPKVKGINQVNNYSGKDGIDICLELQKGIDPEEMKQTLFAMTRLETSVKYMFNALNDRHLHTYSLKRYLNEYTEFQHEIVKNEHRLEQEELSHRLDVITGQLIASMYIDEIIDGIRHTDGKSQVREMLMHGMVPQGTDPKYHATISKFAFTEPQAEAVAGKALYQLNRTDVERLQKEGREIQSRLRIVERIMTDTAYRHQLIISRLETELEKLPDVPRKTRIIQDSISRTSLMEVPTVPMFINMDRYGYVRIEGKPFDGAQEVTNKSRVGFFDRMGNCWNLFLERAKETKDRGTLVTHLVSPEEPVIGFTARIESDAGEGLFLFEDGAIKRVQMGQYRTKTKATKISTQTASHPIKAYFDIPEDKNTVVIDGSSIPLEDIPLQGRSGGGKRLLPAKEEPYQVQFEQKEQITPGLPSQKKTDAMDGTVIFTADGRLLFDWDTLDGHDKDGIYVTTYQKLLKSTLLFIHADGTAKRVLGTQFAVKTRRSQITANKDGVTAVWIQPMDHGTLVGCYAEGKQKRVDVTKIPIQGKSGGGVRVFYTTKYQFTHVIPGDGSDLPIVSFATLPK